jgi:hypothetical protein
MPGSGHKVMVMDGPKPRCSIKNDRWLRCEVLTGGSGKSEFLLGSSASQSAVPSHVSVAIHARAEQVF